MTDRTAPSEQGLGYLLSHASRAVQSQMRDKLRQIGLDDEMWTMLQNIFVAGEPGTSAAESAEKLRMPKGALIDATERLARDGWITPAPKTGAKTGRYVFTSKTRAALPGVRSEAHMLLEHATMGFSHDELEAFAGYLKRVIDNMA
ncbi:MAG: MarR family winged helix-turn-helix transcriptional regulator [Coriobacteriia bacterium]